MTTSDQDSAVERSRYNCRHLISSGDGCHTWLLCDLLAELGIMHNPVSDSDLHALLWLAWVNGSGFFLFYVPQTPQGTLIFRSSTSWGHEGIRGTHWGADVPERPLFSQLLLKHPELSRTFQTPPVTVLNLLEHSGTLQNVLESSKTSQNQSIL